MPACAVCGGANPVGMRFCGHCGAPLSGAPPAPGRDDGLRKMVSRQVAERLASGAELADEWRLVTTLFADISGYVALGERLDPESFAEATNPIVALMSRVAERYDAHVAKFAGDALLCMFGAPVAHEDDADRALDAALEMRAEMDRLRPDLPPAGRDLELHIGVNTGRVVAAVLGGVDRADYNVMGDAVNLAQRLESAAPGGEIYVGDATVRLVRDRFEFDRVGELTVKGKRAPVLAWRLLGRRRRPVRGDDAPLLGRRAEVAAVAEAFSRLLDGRGSVVTVTGDAGIGKSRLCADAAARVRPRGVRAVSARFPSVGTIAYAPYADLLRSLAGVDAATSASATASAVARLARAHGIGHAAAHLARLAGAPEEPGVPANPEWVRRGMHDAFLGLVGALAAHAPLAVTIEDFHWADDASVALTGEMAALCSAHPVALLLTGRPESRAALAGIAASAGPGAARALALEPLDGDEVDRLVGHVLDGAPPAALCEAVRERSAGNPFFVEAIVRSLIDESTLRRGPDGWTLEPGWNASAVPATIEGVLAARLDRLSFEAAALAQIAAVVGRRIRVPLLRAVLGDPVDVDRAVGELVAARMLEPDDSGAERELVFRHALVADVAYERLLRRRRTELHRLVADAAERLYGPDDVEILARHRYLGGAGAAALDVLVAAGERARGLYANDAALVHFERAAEVAPASRRAPLLLEVASLAQLTGDYERALAAYREVREQTGDVRAVRGISSTLRKRGEFDAAIEMLDEALGEGAGDDEAALRLERGWTLSVAGRYAEAIESLRAGLAAAAGRNDDVVASLLLELARAQTVDRDLDAALEHGAAARAIFEERGDERGVASAIRVVAACLQRLGRLDEAAAALRDGLALAERTGSVEELGACSINLGMVELERGAIAGAIECDRRAIAEFERIGHGSGRAIGYGNLAEKLLRAGRIDEASAWCDRALEHARAIGHTPTLADATRTRALIALERGDRDAAREAAEEAARIYDEMGVPAEAEDARRIAARASR